MRMNERMKKALSALLCVSMLAQNAPVVAFAAQEDCTHHAEHTQECGYVAAVEGKPCTHSHDTAVCGYVEEVKEELCDCTETDENGALVHTEGCGYVAPVAGSDCTHGHEESCGYVAAVEGRDCAYRCEICLGSDDEEEEEQETTAPSEPETTEAAEEVEPVEPIELHQTVTIPLELDAAEFDNDEAFAAYVDRLFYGDSGVSTFGPLAGDRLQGAERVIYDRMKAHVAAIAAGTQPADFRISSDDLDVSITLAQTEIGTEIFVQDGETLSITEEAQKELLNRFFNAVNVQQVLYALLSDCPYELYWFDKASADILCEMGAAQDENGALYAVITNLVLTLPVAKDYQVPGTGAMKTDKIDAAAAAAANAKALAAEHQNKTDYEKLVAYKNYICGAVSYNHGAVESDYQGGYGDPWQMIYVFDNNPDTKVVCEGYSKALQYLCDQSGVSCISVGGPFGDEESPGPHLWNIVTLEGKNYLVDLTNSDEDACGKNGELFLAGNASGSVKTGYSFDVGTGEHAGTVTYKYDPAFVAIWDPANLTLAKENYPVPETPEAGECNHSGSAHSAVTDNRNETHSFTCTLCNTNVTVACSVDAKGFCAYGCYEPAANVGDTYQITNAGNLYWFAAHVNSENSSAKAVLTDNIVINTDLSGTNVRSWTPIGSLARAYYGEFDGNGHTISGLYVNADASYVGFVGQLLGTVKNLGIVDSCIKGKERVGAVAGYVKGGAVTNCYHTGTVSGTHYVGGITGYANTGTFTNCYNTGSVTGAQNVGGVAGYAGNVVVTNCYNTGNLIRLPDTSYFLDAGGLVGENHGTVTNCYSTGSLDTGSDTVGALVGLNTGTVKNCYYLAVGETNDQAARDADAFKSGEVAYLLQGTQSTQVWGQTCGQGLPALGGKPVYQITKCEQTAYSNTDKDIDHSWVNGICENCQKVCQHTSSDVQTCMGYQCEICESWYGEKNPNNHVDGCSVTYAPTEGGKHIGTYSCGATTDAEEHDFNSNSKCEACDVEALTIKKVSVPDWESATLTGVCAAEVDEPDEFTAQTTQISEGNVTEGQLIGRMEWNENVGITVTDDNNPDDRDYTGSNVRWIHNGTSWDSSGNILYNQTGGQEISGYYPYSEDGSISYDLTQANYQPLYGTMAVTGSSVDLPVKRKMAKLAVNIAGLPDGQSVTAVELNGIYLTADFDGATGELTSSGNKGAIRMAQNGSSWTTMLIPMEESEVTLRIQLENGDVYAATFKLAPAAGTAYNLTVSLGHVNIKATPNTDGKTHVLTCEACGETIENENHTGGTATCTALAVCADCSASYGSFVEHDTGYTADDTADTITYKCSTCDTQTVIFTLEIPTGAVYNDGRGLFPSAVKSGYEGYNGAVPEVKANGAGIANFVYGAGAYTVTMTLADLTVTGNTSFVIAKADPAYTVPANLTATYGATLADVSLPTGFAWTDATQSVGNVGTNTFTATYDLQNSNYNVIENIAVPVKVAPKAVTSAVITVSGSHTYTGREIKPDVTVADYAANTDYDVAYSNNIHAGTATVTVNFKGNYSGTVTETFQIGKAMLTVTADNKSATTGRDLPALTYTITGFVGGETASVLTAQPVAATTADGNTKGTYDITVSGAAAANYDFTYVKGELTVADHVHAWSYKADGAVITATCGNAATCSDPEQTITISAVGKTYDGTPVTAILTGNIDGVDTPAIRYFKNGTELIESAIHAGTYTAAIQLGTAEAKEDFTVAAKELTVTGAEIEAVTYNTAGVYALEVSSVTLDGIVRGDTAEHSATAAFTGTNAAGSQEATVTVTLDNTDYVLKTAVYKTTVTVNKAVYTVSAPDEDDLAQTHFFAYATANTVDLTQHLPADRGATSYEVKPVTGDIFSVAPAVTEAGALSYTTRKLTAAPASDAEIRITVEMGNYEDVELKVPVKLLAVTAQTPQRIHHTDLTEVPVGLTDKFQSVAAIQETQRQVLVSALGKTPDGIAHYDVNLQFSPDGGETWMNAAEENFPENGLTVTLPYPSGTGKDSHHFVVSHMFTSGEKAGTTEKPVVTKTAEGIQFTVTGLSPVSVAWSAIPFNIKLVPTTNGTVYVSSAQAAAGTQITVTVTPNYGYRLSTLTVLDDAGNYCVLGAVNDNAYMFHMPAANVTVAATFVSNSTAVADTTNPKTGDDFHMAFWGGMMMTTMLGVTALLLNRKKFFQK